MTSFKAAATDPKFVDLMVGRGNIMMNIAGAEADEFLKKWQSTTAWVLHEAKATKASPEQFGIPKP